MSVALVILASLVGCSSGERPVASDASTAGVAEPQRGGQLAVGVELSAETVFPAVLETLTVVDARGEVVPFLAASVTADEGATEWLIRLRPGIAFHNGEPLDAAAVEPPNPLAGCPRVQGSDLLTSQEPALGARCD